MKRYYYDKGTPFETLKNILAEVTCDPSLLKFQRNGHTRTLVGHMRHQAKYNSELGKKVDAAVRATSVELASKPDRNGDSRIKLARELVREITRNGANGSVRDEAGHVAENLTSEIKLDNTTVPRAQLPSGWSSSRKLAL